MRAPVLLESWWKRTDLGEVALYSLTGTLTSPKLIAPDQIARAIRALYSERAVRSRRERSLARDSGAISHGMPRRVVSSDVDLPPFQELIDMHGSDVHRFLVAMVGSTA